ncbi:hypothetical protein [Endozoicomonas atrinae]|uniref:hypothetical protein n=1 Tax=Endozoicomonas atrinae TaxID=1333660 RepID=UPI0008250AD0|nr:hypothetical protein [Endozoicomonas atrinae]
MMTRYFIAIAGLLILSGCASFYQQPQHEPEMVRYSQDSVRDIFIAQRYNPSASGENSGKAVTGMDGERSRLILKTWREREPDEDALNEDIEFEIESDE